MRTFLILWRRELGAYFLSPVAYVMTMFFLFFMGYSFWSLVDWLVEGVANAGVMQILFGESLFFWIAMLIVIPLLTMRLFAEEKRAGTIETLMTAPVGDTSVVLAKYAGAMTFFVFMWLPTAVYVFVVRRFDPGATVDMGSMLTGYAGAFLVGSFYISLGLLASSLTRNQIIAAIITFSLICTTFVGGFVAYVARAPAIRDLAAYLSTIRHMMDFSRGIVDTRPIVLYTTGTILMLFATIRIMESRRWK